MKLFAIVVGGEHPRANVEIHDVRFVVADRIEDTYDALKAQWWGAPGTLHIDCWAQIDHVDGFDVIIDTEPQARAEQLYFVNLGGYDLHQFAELHRNVFVVATSAKEAKVLALAKGKGWRDLHRDDFYEVEQVVTLSEVLKEDGAHIWLQHVLETRELAFTCKYTPLR